MTKTILRVENLSAGYDGIPVMKNISFEILQGEIAFICGGSGCGKSTLLKHLIGQCQPMEGSIFIDGEDFGNSSGKKREELIRKFGVMYQSGALFGSMTLLENVILPLESFTDLPKKIIEQVALMKLRQVGLEEYGNFYPAEISGGMKKRAAIARAMALEPAILFLDEPSAGLDPITSAELDSLIKRLSRKSKTTVIIISHELASINAIADRVFFLDKEIHGLLDSGTPEFLRNNSKFEKIRNFFNRKPMETFEC